MANVGSTTAQSARTTAGERPRNSGIEAMYFE
jgi:hypothetical protein